MKLPDEPMKTSKNTIPRFKLTSLENEDIEKFAKNAYEVLTMFYPETFPRTCTEYRISYGKQDVSNVCGAADTISNVMWLFVNNLHETIAKRKEIFPKSINDRVDNGLITINELYSNFIVENVVHELFHINQYQPNIYDSNKRFQHYTNMYENAVDFETLVFLFREEDFLNYAFQYIPNVYDEISEMIDLYRDEIFARCVRIAMQDKWKEDMFKEAKELSEAYLRKIGIRGFIKFLWITKLNLKYVKYKKLSIETAAGHFLLNGHPNLREINYTNTDLKNARKLIRDLAEFNFGCIRKRRDNKKYDYVYGVEIKHVEN